MARMPRSRISGDVNHVMIRGIGHMDLFMRNNDYLQFLKTMKRFIEGDGVTIYTYCLMTNHVHLLLKGSAADLSLFMKRLEVSYASYFNGLYDHTGHLFQNRYKNEIITSDSRFLSALRYILRNPSAAGMCSWEQYPWSSASSYLSCKNDGITDTSFAFELLGDKALFHAFVQNEDASSACFAEPASHRRSFTDSDAINLIRKVTGLASPIQISTLAASERTEMLVRLKSNGLTIRQLERLTGINRNVIQRAKSHEPNVGHEAG